MVRSGDGDARHLYGEGEERSKVQRGRHRWRRRDVTRALAGGGTGEMRPVSGGGAVSPGEKGGMGLTSHAGWAPKRHALLPQADLCRGTPAQEKSRDRPEIRCFQRALSDFVAFCLLSCCS
jgi:hypothetical protein